MEASGAAKGVFGGPRAERTVSEQWGADAICDPLALKQLQDVYRAALQLPPFADPGFLDVEQARTSKQGLSKHHDGGAPSNAVARVDLQRDVPHGWFHTGPRSQVPDDATYAGHAGGTWVWVTPDKLADLSRFALIILFITKLGPGEDTNTQGGLMYTGGGQ